MSNHRLAADLVAAVRRATRSIREKMDLDVPPFGRDHGLGLSCTPEDIEGGFQTVNFRRLLDRSARLPGERVFMTQFRSDYGHVQEVVALLQKVQSVLAAPVPEAALVSTFFGELCEFDLYRFEIRAKPTRYRDPELFGVVAPTYEVDGRLFRINSRLLDDLDEAAYSAARMIILRPATASEATPAEELRNCFHRVEGDWTVRYGSSRYFSLKFAISGATYLHHLLQRPGQETSVGDLAAAWSRHKAQRRRGEPIPAGGVGRSSHDGEVIDATGRRQIWAELGQIAVELKEAEDGNDVGKVYSLQLKQYQLQEALQKATRTDGSPVLLADQLKQVTDRVTKAISRVITLIGKSNRDLGLHLEDCVVKGPTCRYSPAAPIAWET